MDFGKKTTWLVLVQGLALCTVVQARQNSTSAVSETDFSATPVADRARATADKSASQLTLESIGIGQHQSLFIEVLERNPEIARARYLAAAAEALAPQLRALPDPTAALSLFVLPPETRSGPQQFSVSVQQKLPWFGKLSLKEKAATYAAAAASARVEATRLDKLAEARRAVAELAFLDAREAILFEERNALVRYERAAQARYASGSGLQQEIVRIQAQITRTDARLLEISERRWTLRSALNALRDRPVDYPLESSSLPEAHEPTFDLAALKNHARSRRPEINEANAEIAAGQALVALAQKGYRPDVAFGLSYTAVGRRDDAPGLLLPPPDNGDDILALSASLNLPVRKRKLAAGVEQAQAQRRAAEEKKRQTLAHIEGSIGDLVSRMPLLYQHLQLLENVLLKQAREALRSAETAYSTGKLNAVDLLDAEIVMFEVKVAAKRTRTDLAVAWIQLERTIAGPAMQSTESPNQ